ncbi:MAG: hypothetical protein ACI4IE_09120 [Eubacterium sp.]
MELRQTRRIISSLLSFVIAMCVAVSVFSVCAAATVTNKNYAVKHFVTDELVAECDRQLSKKFASLANESQIPARVFETVKDNVSTRTSLQQGVLIYYSDEEIQNDTISRADYFYKLCVEYLEGNHIKYDKKSIERTAQKAADIYRETVNMKCSDELHQLIDSAGSTAAKVSSASLAFIVISMIMMSLIYNDMMKAYTYMAGAFSAGSASSLLFCLFALITEKHNVISIQPKAHYDALCSLFGSSLIVTIVISAVLLAVSLGCTVIIKRTGEKRAGNSLSKYMNGM